MSGLVPIGQLPERLTHQQAVEVTYQEEIDWVEDKLLRGMNALVECDKQLVLYLYKAFRKRLKARNSNMRLRLIGGPPQSDEDPPSIIANTVKQLRDTIFSGESGLCLVIPHLDVAVTTTKSGLSDRAREVVAMLYENPELTFLAFRDPSFEMPKAVSDVFPAKREILGIARDQLRHIVCQREARKFSVEEFNPFSLYKYVSGLNAVRFREIMGNLQNRLDYNPDDPGQLDALFRDIRDMTLTSEMELPSVDLEKDIGGYEKVKERIRKEILHLLGYKERLQDAQRIKEIEEIIPKGMLFVGPPGTGKTFFAKAMATSLNATVTIVSGPELKSKWVGESEENLRRVFSKARKSAPSIIVFDELDSFATARGTYQGSGVEHSMVNQLLTEMDGFRKEELIFVVGTTNFPESIDTALLRPGRFELQIEIPYPNDDDRKVILEIYREKFKLNLSDDLVTFLVQKTAGFVNQSDGTRYSGDHLYAVARALKREEVRRIQELYKEEKPIPEGGVELTQDDCVRALSKKKKGPIKFKDVEERTIAIHEAGHAILAHFCPKASAIERITIATGDEDTLGYVLRGVRDNKYVTTRDELFDDICVLLGGRVAEEIVIGDVSVGASNDFMKATEIARVMVEELGMSARAGVRVYTNTQLGHMGVRGERRAVSDDVAKLLDESIREILDAQYVRATDMMNEHREKFDLLVDTLLEKKTLLKDDVVELLGKPPYAKDDDDEDEGDGEEGAA